MPSNKNWIIVIVLLCVSFAYVAYVRLTPGNKQRHSVQVMRAILNNMHIHHHSGRSIQLSPVLKSWKDLLFMLRQNSENVVGYYSAFNGSKSFYQVIWHPQPRHDVFNSPNTYIPTGDIDSRICSVSFVRV